MGVCLLVAIGVTLLGQSVGGQNESKDAMMLRWSLDTTQTIREVTEISTVATFTPTGDNGSVLSLQGIATDTHVIESTRTVVSVDNNRLLQAKTKVDTHELVSLRTPPGYSASEQTDAKDGPLTGSEITESWTDDGYVRRMTQPATTDSGQRPPELEKALRLIRTSRWSLLLPDHSVGEGDTWSPDLSVIRDQIGRYAHAKPTIEATCELTSLSLQRAVIECKLTATGLAPFKDNDSRFKRDMRSSARGSIRVTIDRSLGRVMQIITQLTITTDSEILRGRIWIPFSSETTVESTRTIQTKK